VDGDRADSTDDYGPAIEYWDGDSWETYTGTPVAIPAGSTTLLVRTAIVADTLDEGDHGFTLKATNTGGTSGVGTATIDDHGGGVKFPDTAPTGPSNGQYTPPSNTTDLDDDRPLTVNDIRVNEGSPFAVFTVTGASGQLVSLALTDSSATQDVDGDRADSTDDYGPAIEYWDGNSWETYTGTPVAIPAGSTTLLVRTAIVADTLDEGDHGFTLKATNTGGSSGVGTATIDDHGGGVKFPDANPSGPTNGQYTPPSNTTDLDDDRPIKLSDVTVNEASPYAVFRVEASSFQKFSLALSDGAVGFAAGKPTANAGIDYLNSIQTYDGKVWVDYVPDSLVSVPDGGSVLLVRVPILNDDVYEDAHAFTLTATLPGQVPVTAKGIIGDFGTGAIFNDSGAENRTAPKDDDRGIKIDSPIVNENSDFVVFTLKGQPGPLQLELPVFYETDEPLAEIDKATSNIEFWNGISWQTYTTGATIPDSGELLVRVGIQMEDDRVREGSEHFALVARRDGVASMGEASIRDDGTGVIHQFAADGSFSGSTTVGLDDDFDKDGITPTTEEALATLAASQGIGDAAKGDLNGDGLLDQEQNALATLAWTTKEYFDQGNDGTLTDSKAIISISVTDPADPERVSATTQLIGIVVEKYDVIDASTQVDIADDGSRTVTLADGFSKVTTPWDPIRFGLEGIDKDNDGKPDAGLADIDASRSGTQVRLLIDVRASGLLAEQVNGYIKYVSQEVINKLGDKLVDLDGKPITQAGWYDFKQRVKGGDGASFIYSADGKKVEFIELIITDNAFGDNDAAIDRIFDPGVPVLVQPFEPAPQHSEREEPAYVLPAAPMEFTPGPRFEYLPFDSTLYSLAADASLKPQGLIERNTWGWSDRDRDWDFGRYPAFHAADSTWQVSVVASDQASLQVFRGMGDQFAKAATEGSFGVPADAFVHTQAGIEVTLSAKLADGTDLPRWVRFDARAGKFSFDPPADFRGELRIKLIARDAQGREATTLFRFHVGDNAQPGRMGLSAQLREASVHKSVQRAASLPPR
jgi:hypothetical protein